MKLLSLPLLALLTLGLIAADRPGLPLAHTEKRIEGWTIRVDDRLLKNESAAQGERALQLLNARLTAISMVVPEPALTKLRTITIQLDLDYADLKPMQYHPGADWLRDHGYSASLAKCVHIPDTVGFLSPFENHRMPWVVLHELAHAYHDQILSFDQPGIIAQHRHFNAERFPTRHRRSGRNHLTDALHHARASAQHASAQYQHRRVQHRHLVGDGEGQMFDGKVIEGLGRGVAPLCQHFQVGGRT